MSEKLDRLLKQIGKETIKGGAIHELAASTKGLIAPAGNAPNAPPVPTDLPTTITAVTAIINALKARGIFNAASSEP